MVIGSWSKSRGKVIGCRSLCRFKMNRCLLCKIVFGLSINSKLLFYQTYFVSNFLIENSIILCSLRCLKLCLQQIPRNSKPRISMSFLIDRTPNGIIFAKGAVCGCQSRSSKECSLAIGRRGGGENPQQFAYSWRVVSDAFQVSSGDLQPL